jgi:hypothetical protein
MPLVRPRACDLSLILTFVPSCRSASPGGGAVPSQRSNCGVAICIPPIPDPVLLGRVGWSERGCQNTLIIGSARYPVKPRCGQLPKGPRRAPKAENSDFHRNGLATFHFWRINPRRVRQEPRKLKEITDVELWPGNCFPTSSGQDKSIRPKIRPRSGSPSTHVWCGSPAGEKAPEHTVALFWRP